ncbi:MAG: hypothetical protein EOP51_03990 [Sphingobacteriales bacterium]|nr:MAG: hypothetical protein EOP51_03990 [Sphingobacteriales bacterium]
MNNKPSPDNKQKADDGADKSAAHLLDNYSKQPATQKSGSSDSPYYQSQAPSISLPKGGGAIKGIDEKFTVNAVNGTSSLQIPLPLTSGRSEFTPSLSLDYNSGNGNSEFGLGWGLSLPAIQRKTDKQLPLYQDSKESDVFLLAGAEDLVPMLDTNGLPIVITSGVYTIKRYVPRIEGLFARIEFISKANTPDTWWRVVTKENIVTYYGLTATARITDPQKNFKIFKWLPQLSYDFKGNAQVFEYIAEDLQQVPQSAHERNHLNGLAPIVNTYLKSVKYCNRTPYVVAAGSVYEPAIPTTINFLMQAVVDYGDHDLNNPTPTRSTTQWPYRTDAFSDFHAGFEIRTYRKCRRVLMFHYFKELGDNVNENPILVRSLDFLYKQDGTPDYCEADFITSMVQSGYKRNTATTYFKKSLPALTFDHFPLQWNTEVKAVSNEDVRNTPQGLTGPYQWIDLWGEGLPGILTEQGYGWFYKENKGDAHFGGVTQIRNKPSLTGLGSSLQWEDLDADGRRQLVTRETSLPGFFELDDDQQWQPFKAFKGNPSIDWDSPFTKMLDMDGDGRADLLITDDTVWTWYKNIGTEGYETGGRHHAWQDEEQGPRLLVKDDVQCIYLADMNGDGLTDLVRIKNGEVCYWANKGYGKFGAKVTMSNAPYFDNPDDYNPLYIVLADISATGASDIIYLGNNRCTAWINLSGNAFSAAKEISPLPGNDQYSKVAVMDFLGNGTACIVWSSPLPHYAQQPLQYIDLMGGNKPYLMSSYSNGMGKSVELSYKSAIKYYLADKAAGTPWATRLPFPVYCVSEIKTIDSVSETQYRQTYSYHHGYYDHAEREFRGFGRVNTIDADMSAELDQWPVLTKTWYHTGAWLREANLLEAFAKEYYTHPSWWAAPQQAQFPSGLTAIEWREAHRALKSLPLRQEVYAMDDDLAKKNIPYAVTAYSYQTNLVQPKKDNRYASFLTWQQQKITWGCERIPEDPRVLHEMTLEADKYGNVLQAVQVAYPRQQLAGLPAPVSAEQSKMLVTFTQSAYTTATLSDAVMYRLPVLYQAATYQVYNLTVPTTAFILPATLYTPGGSNNVKDFTNIDYSATPAIGVKTIRSLSMKRISFLADDGVTVLALGAAIGTVLLERRKYQQAFTIGTGSILAGTPVDHARLIAAGYLREDSIPEFASANTTRYWMPGGTVDYNPTPLNSFYQPIAYKDPWGNATTIAWWGAYYLLPQSVTDAKSNVSTVNKYDWRCLQPQTVTDINNNVSEILYDCLCMPVAMALKGKVSGSVFEADELGTLNAEDPTDILNQQKIFDPAFGPSAVAATLLGHATWRCVYDLDTSPTAVVMIARELHYQYCVAKGITSPLQVRYTYTDGLGRIAMYKAQAADTPVTGTPRWIGSGKTIYNNKGNAVMQYEPYYSTTFAYDPDAQAAAAGVSPKMHYDPLNRVFRVDQPDGTFSKTEWTSWLQKSYDGNDTVLDSNWYTTMIALGGNYAATAAKAAVHNNTPTVQHLDTLARPFYTIQHNKLPDGMGGYTDAFYPTLSSLDITGNPLTITDARSIVTLTYRYNMLPAPLVQDSKDSGLQYILLDVGGQPANNWDAGNREFIVEYDTLRRPVKRTVNDSGLKTLEVTNYGEAATTPEAFNLRGEVYQLYDGAGLMQMNGYDFKGNLLTTQQKFLTVYTTKDVDWDAGVAPALNTETFTTSITYDALNRQMKLTDAGANETTNTYDKAGQLYTVQMKPSGLAVINYITSILYNAKGQRTETNLGSGTRTTYTYDAQRFRLTRLVTVKTTSTFQDLNYIYDPVGNICYLKDDAQRALFFNNSVTLPVQDFTYDALYRLTKGNGRELIANAVIGGGDNYNDANHMGVAFKGTDNNTQNYTQNYVYDAVGNITSLQHVAGTGSYTRGYTYLGNSNRLLSTSVNTSPVSNYSYTHDERGNLATMPHLSLMGWNALNQLYRTTNGTTNNHNQYSGGQRVRKVVEKTGSIKEERLYIGNYEVYRKYTGATLNVERITVNVNDDSGRIALYEKRTAGTDTSVATLQRYVYSNHISTATLELDNTAAIISYEEYHPYGTTSYQAMNASINAVAKRYRFTNKERDEETGFYYHGARYYAPWLGRWTAVDPLAAKFAPESAYCYAHNNPVVWMDPDGMDPKHDGDVNKNNSKSENQTANNATMTSMAVREATREVSTDLAVSAEGKLVQIGAQQAEKGVLGELFSFLGGAAVMTIALVFSPTKTGGGDVLYRPDGSPIFQTLPKITLKPKDSPFNLQNITEGNNQNQPYPEPDPKLFSPAPIFGTKKLDGEATIYRSMRTQDGNWIKSPLIGAPNRAQLGARTPATVKNIENADVRPVGELELVGIWYTGLKGLSANVVPTLFDVKETIGEIQVKDLPKGLEAIQDGKNHISIFPAGTMQFKDYQILLNSVNWKPIK